MDAQSIGHLYFVVLMIISNVLFFVVQGARTGRATA